MSLSDRLAARRCAVAECSEDRATDAQLCPRHLTDLWMRRLDRAPDGSYVARHALRARDESGYLRAAR